MSGEKEFFLTREGLKKIKKEYQSLLEEREKIIKAGVPPVLQSEEANPDYLSFKEEIELIDKKIFYLKDVLEKVKLIRKPPKQKRNIVSLGATVLLGVDGNLSQFKIVSSLEADPSLGKISIQSPVGNSLLGHKVGDIVLVSARPKKLYKIKKIIYEDI